MNIDFQTQPLTVSISELATWHLELETHLNHRKLARRSASLAKQHLHVFELWYQATFNQVFDPHLLTNYDLHLYREFSLTQEKVKAATWNSRLWALTILCEWLNDETLLEGIEGKAQVRGSTKHRALTTDEYHRLIHALEQNTRRAVTQFEYLNAVRDWASVLLMLHGLRVDECASVEVDDITIHERSGDVLVRNGKGSKERTVPLNLIARKALASWTSVRPATTTKPSPKSDALSYLGEVGEARWGLLFNVTVRTLQRNVESLGKQIGVPDLTPHWLRYTFAKRLEKNNTPLETIRDLLGHESIETTRRYLRSSLEELQSAVEGVM